MVTDSAFLLGFREHEGEQCIVMRYNLPKSAALICLQVCCFGSTTSELLKSNSFGCTETANIASKIVVSKQLSTLLSLQQKE